MTGETGAGKSIMIDGLQLLLGDRADFGLIRQGSSQALVEGTFDISNQAEIKKLLSEADIPHENELLIRRVLNTIIARNAFSTTPPSPRACLQKLDEDLFISMASTITKHFLIPLVI